MTHKNFLERCYFVVRFAYDGHNFHGVQEQPNLKTVLGAVRARIEASTPEMPRSLMVTARTDRGVSALVNYASFYLKTPVDVDAFLAATKRDVADDLYGVVFERAQEKFHARGHSASKTYRYTIKDGVLKPANSLPMIWEIAPTLSLAALRFAARDFVGRMDFSSVRGGGCESKSSIKEVLSIDIARTRGGYIIIDIRGTGFLRKMVRNIVGLLVEVGAGLRQCDAVAPILLARSRLAAGIQAPAHGLCLFDIERSS